MPPELQQRVHEREKGTGVVSLTGRKRMANLWPCVDALARLKADGSQPCVRPADRKTPVPRDRVAENDSRPLFHSASMPLIRLPWRRSTTLAPFKAGSAEMRGTNPLQIRMTPELVPRLCFFTLRDRASAETRGMNALQVAIPPGLLARSGFVTIRAALTDLVR